MTELLLKAVHSYAFVCYFACVLCLFTYFDTLDMLQYGVCLSLVHIPGKFDQ